MVTFTLTFTLLFKGQMLRFRSSWHNVKARIIAPQRKNCNVCIKFTKAISCRLLCVYLAVGCEDGGETFSAHRAEAASCLSAFQCSFTLRAKQPQLLLSSYSPEHCQSNGRASKHTREQLQTGTESGSDRGGDFNLKTNNIKRCQHEKSSSCL